MRIQVRRAPHYTGTTIAPGDKSISHRSLIFAALGEGPCEVTHLGPGADVRSTASCLKTLGIDVTIAGESARVVGRGLTGLERPQGTLDCGNSGTTMRLFTGIVAGSGVGGVLDGDASLRRRPMRRVLDPMRAMGAECAGERDEQGRELAPLRFTPGRALKGCRHEVPVASAQVKSCILLAGLWAEGTTSVREPLLSRDHTERMLRAFGVPLQQGSEGTLSVTKCKRLQVPARLQVAGDPSSSAFLLAPALIVPGGHVSVEQVGVNPTRSGFLRVIQRMGATVRIGETIDCGGEPVATVEARESGCLRATDVTPEEIPSLVDEVPLISVLASQAEGTTTIRGASELRVKESDRLAMVTRGLAAMGAQVEELPDGLVVHGPTKLKGARIESASDHRIAMCFAVAGLVADGTTLIEDAECADISFPGFYERMAALTGGAMQSV
ncbi:MAG: 3-phosphoshikimate 1-carboxyvinyltransferase [Planctomycetota bacterium]